MIRLALSEQRKIIKAIRKKHNLTQEQLAKKCGYSVSAISKFEQGADVITERFAIILFACFPDFKTPEPPEKFDWRDAGL